MQAHRGCRASARKSVACAANNTAAAARCTHFGCVLGLLRGRLGSGHWGRGTERVDAKEILLTNTLKKTAFGSS
eukprot:5662170-Alexandrium_andersonii.AAC.1